MFDRFIFISTLDGKLTALDIADGGSETWELSTEPGPLLSSSIDQLEVNKVVDKLLYSYNYLLCLQTPKIAHYGFKNMLNN